MAEHILEIAGLTKSFGAVQACRDLSFEVAAGQVHALIGPNGAGKTTLVNLLSGELRPDSGTIRFAGVDIGSRRVHQRAGLGLGRSFQITSIFANLSVADNIRLAIVAGAGHNYRFWRPASRSPAVAGRLQPALARVGLEDKADAPAAALSHGEKRQLEVGMALVSEPKLLMLDEPMAGLGAGGTVQLKKLIRELKGAMTILLVEHDMDAVFSLADRISVMNYGSCIATGTVDEIRADPVVQASYLGGG